MGRGCRGKADGQRKEAIMTRNIIISETTTALDYGIMKRGTESRVVAVGPDVSGLWAAYGLPVTDNWSDEESYNNPSDECIARSGVKLSKDAARLIFPLLDNAKYRR